MFGRSVTLLEDHGIMGLYGHLEEEVRFEWSRGEKQRKLGATRHRQGKMGANGTRMFAVVKGGIETLKRHHR